MLHVKCRALLTMRRFLRTSRCGDGRKMKYRFCRYTAASRRLMCGSCGFASLILLNIYRCIRSRSCSGNVAYDGGILLVDRQCPDIAEVRAEACVFPGCELFAALPTGNCGDDCLGHVLVLSLWNVLVLAMPAVDIAVLLPPADVVLGDGHKHPPQHPCGMLVSITSWISSA